MLLGLNLPKVCGAEVLAKFRKSKTLRRHAIVMSSSGSAADRAPVELLGISHYFQKPSDLNAFMQLGELVAQFVTRIHSCAETKPPGRPVSQVSRSNRVSGANFGLFDKTLGIGPEHYDAGATNCRVPNGSVNRVEIERNTLKRLWVGLLSSGRCRPMLKTA